jgi:ADP-heptose:LPS heptosyltransferase
MEDEGGRFPVVISPFANERLRQWPWRHYRALVGLIVREHGLPVVIVGTRDQRVAANDIVRGLSSETVANVCGSRTWAEVVEAVDNAPYVVANNSGVAHSPPRAGAGPYASLRRATPSTNGCRAGRES